MALCLILVLSVSNWNFLTILLRYRVTNLSRHLPLNLILNSLTLLLRFMLGDLLVVGGALIFVLSVAVLLGNMLALLSGNILAVFLWYILTVLLRHLVTHLFGLAVTLSVWY